MLTAHTMRDLIVTRCICCIFLIFLLTTITSALSSGDICYKMCQNESSSYLQTYCHGDLSLNNSHCCYNTSSSPPQIIGIDLRGCDVTQIKVINNFIQSLIVISLEDNPIKSVDTSNFTGLINAQYLSLPPSIDCPGGNDAWESVESSNISTICKNQTDLCLQLNVTCPTNSECVNISPGYYECHCLPDYHGYKCLKKGKFPTTYYGIGMAITTVSLAVILWFLQRRLVIKKQA